MPKRIIPLSEMKIQKVKPKNKPFSLFDGGGLYLLVTPSGGKLWRFKYRFEGKEKKIAFGAYPEISLLNARQRRDEARRLLAQGIDPSAARKARKQAILQEIETFELIAREWHTRFLSTWTTKYAETLMSRLELYIFPWIGKRPIAEIKAPELLAVLRRIESRGILDTTQRVRIICGQVFRYAVVTGRAERDPTTDLKGALPQPKRTHRAAITDPKKVGKLLRAIDSYQGSSVVQCA